MHVRVHVAHNSLIPTSGEWNPSHELIDSERTCGEWRALRGKPWASSTTEKMDTRPQGSNHGGLAGKDQRTATP